MKIGECQFSVTGHMKHNMEKIKNGVVRVSWGERKAINISKMCIDRLSAL